MLCTSNTASQVDEELLEYERLVKAYESEVKRHCEGLVYKNSVFTPDDVDDLIAVTNARLWNGYFRDSSRGQYTYRSQVQDIVLLKKIATNAARDLARVRIKEQRILRTIEFDAPLHGEAAELRTLGDVLSAPTDTAAEVEICMLVSEVLTQACRDSNSPGKQIVARLLLGELSKEDVYALGYNSNYINQETHRFRLAIKAALCK